MRNRRSIEIIAAPISTNTVPIWKNRSKSIVRVRNSLIKNDNLKDTVIDIIDDSTRNNFTDERTSMSQVDSYMQ